MEKMFLTVIPFYFRFYISVQIFIGIERIKQIYFYFWRTVPLGTGELLTAQSWRNKCDPTESFHFPVKKTCFFTIIIDLKNVKCK